LLLLFPICLSLCPTISLGPALPPAAVLLSHSFLFSFYGTYCLTINVSYTFEEEERFGEQILKVPKFYIPTLNEALSCINLLGCH
jgi:hypothetical protein